MVKLSAKERIEKVVCWAGLNTSTFATHIGLSSPQTLYQIKSGKHNISRSLAEKICTHYPEIDFGWLFAGEGEMTRPQDTSIPYYAVDCTEVALGNISAVPHGRTNMVGCGDCAFAAPYNSGSMEPEVGRGSTLFLKEVALGEVLVGQTVLVATGSMATLRKVAKIDGAQLLLVGPEGGTTPPTTLDTTQIKRIFILKATLEWRYI